MKKIIILVAIVTVGVGLIFFTASNPSMKAGSGSNRPATKKEHDSANKLFQEAMKDVNQKNYKSALDKMDRVIKQDPKMLQAYVIRGSLKQRLGDIQGAYDDYSTAVKLNPKDRMAQSQKERIEKMPMFKNKAAMQKMKEGAERAAARGKSK